MPHKHQTVSANLTPATNQRSTMIHHTLEGHHIKLGLNYSRTRAGFRLLWAWYDFAKHEAFAARFRFRWDIKPRFLWEVRRWCVIESYLAMNNFELVSTETLEDLKSSVELSIRYGEHQPSRHV